MVVEPGLCGTWSETPKTGFLTTRLIYTCYDDVNAFLDSLVARQTVRLSGSHKVIRFKKNLIIFYVKRDNHLKEY